MMRNRQIAEQLDLPGCIGRCNKKIMTLKLDDNRFQKLFRINKKNARKVAWLVSKKEMGGESNYY